MLVRESAAALLTDHAAAAAHDDDSPVGFALVAMLTHDAAHLQKQGCASDAHVAGHRAESARGLDREPRVVSSRPLSSNSPREMSD